MSEGELVLGAVEQNPATVRIAGCSATARPACLHCVASKLRKKRLGSASERGSTKEPDDPTFTADFCNIVRRDWTSPQRRE